MLLPALARLRQPLALIEVGASAELCLLLDRYSYDYGSCRIEPPFANFGDPPVFECVASAMTPLAALPTIKWRCGLDLNPLDINSPADRAWLEDLIWPDQEHRLETLRKPIEIARSDPPHVRRGDLLDDLPEIIALAPQCWGPD